MDKLLFWLGLGAAQKGAGSKPIESSPSFAIWMTVLATRVAMGALRDSTFIRLYRVNPR
jgi:hypothetical protein